MGAFCFQLEKLSRLSLFSGLLLQLLLLLLELDLLPILGLELLSGFLTGFKVDLHAGTLLLDIVLDDVVSSLHVDPPPLCPIGQEVDCALQEPDLFDDVYDVELAL